MNIKRKKERHLRKHAILCMRGNTLYTNIYDSEGAFIGIAEKHVPKSESNVKMIVRRGKHK